MAEPGNVYRPVAWADIIGGIGPDYPPYIDDLTKALRALPAGATVERVSLPHGSGGRLTGVAILRSTAQSMEPPHG